ncbi:phospholipase A1 [Microbulbifer donghaiensis]|uniref:Phospholipase A1 n=1 Tax=Microbulbifer donghaiensis TaxID=494016 RepID=A0A1M4YC11_9GAMM|nr:phospholipase A [Microbulbifer donghaiensis]SHF03123.1 phospholipase A1 [Microbulbifer donghaiensis]
MPLFKLFGGLGIAALLAVDVGAAEAVSQDALQEATESVQKALEEATAISPEEQEENCLREQLVGAPASTTLDEMRRFCAQQVYGPPMQREARPPEGMQPVDTLPEPRGQSPVEEVPVVGTSQAALAIREAASNPFTLASHKVNYLLPAVYNPSPNKAGLEGVEFAGETLDKLDKVEVQFQLSVQVPVWRGFLGQASFMSVAYTNRSFWQAYNSEISAPFRETNHEPELIMTWLNDWSLFGWQNVANQVAINHQSNGRSEPLSRSWNRIYTNLLFEKDDRYFISFKPWYRIPEKREKDDNPDIEAYLGHFELTGAYRCGGHQYGIMLRNNLRSDNRGAVELRWSFPIGSRVRGYVKYFNGYGESLIDYDESVQTLGFGFELARGL